MVKLIREKKQQFGYKNNVKTKSREEYPFLHYFELFVGVLPLSRVRGLNFSKCEKTKKQNNLPNPVSEYNLNFSEEKRKRYLWMDVKHFFRSMFTSFENIRKRLNRVKVLGTSGVPSILRAPAVPMGPLGPDPLAVFLKNNIFKLISKDMKKKNIFL